MRLDSIASLFYGEACSIDPCAGRAYQWSRHPPSITHPRENVIIRLCSIECNFGAPLTVRPTAFQQCFVAAPFLLDLCLHSALLLRCFYLCLN